MSALSSTAMRVATIVLTLSTLITPALGQFSNPRYGRRRRLAGGVIAGIVVAAIAGLLFCMLICLACRRRRRQLPILPSAMGPGYFRTSGPGPRPMQQTGNMGNMNYQPPQGPPPTYQGGGVKRGLFGGMKGNGAANGMAMPQPQTGGYAPPPGAPPRA
ncbi:hypothetical protein BDW22DRAFT_1361398 [Trametopsis cervina]|nr:hypothetical protein BDW22DRAFT_1361398 [Trametopsis cervina]